MCGLPPHACWAVCLLTVPSLAPLPYLYSVYIVSLRVVYSAQIQTTSTLGGRAGSRPNPWSFVRPWHFPPRTLFFPLFAGQPTYAALMPDWYSCKTLIGIMWTPSLPPPTPPLLQVKIFSIGFCRPDSCFQKAFWLVAFSQVLSQCLFFGIYSALNTWCILVGEFRLIVNSW